jgi:hypothetical protein
MISKEEHWSKTRKDRLSYIEKDCFEEEKTGILQHR